jgi:hypothetical protein
MIAAMALTAAGCIAAQEPRAKRAAEDPPVHLTLTSLQPKYKLDLGGKSAREFLEAIDAAVKKGDRPPLPPEVDLELELKNTGDKPLQVWVEGDPVQILLELTGPGAKTVAPPLMMTAEFRSPKPVTLEPGGSHRFALKQLQSGMRGVGRCSYWTEPGEYTLTASLKTGLAPAGASAEPDADVTRVTLTSNTIRMQVAE